jgi:hypothetical protein
MIPCTIGTNIGKVSNSNIPFEAIFLGFTTSISSNVMSKIDYGECSC